MRYSGPADVRQGRRLGHDRPEQDLILFRASDAILIRDWRAEALFGTAEAQ